jgi:hypothetical protein
MPQGRADRNTGARVPHSCRAVGTGGEHTAAVCRLYISHPIIFGFNSRLARDLRQQLKQE